MTDQMTTPPPPPSAPQVVYVEKKRRRIWPWILGFFVLMGVGFFGCTALFVSGVDTALEEVSQEIEARDAAILAEVPSCQVTGTNVFGWPTVTATATNASAERSTYGVDIQVDDNGTRFGTAFMSIDNVAAGASVTATADAAPDVDDAQVSSVEGLTCEILDVSRFSAEF